MMSSCSECGAPVPAGGSCRDHLHALLVMEWSIPVESGELAHYFAVTSYNLQHPDSMNLTATALAGARDGLAAVLDGRLSLDELRRRARRSAQGPIRVTRRPGEAAPAWKRGTWPVTIAEVIAGRGEGYSGQVERWARSVLEALNVEDLA